MSLTQPGRYGPTALQDTLGNALPDAAVTAPDGYTATVDGVGNLTVTGPPDDAVQLTITPAGGSAFAVTVTVPPQVTELAAVADTAAAAETPAGAQAKANTARAAAEAFAAAEADAAELAAITAAATDATTKAAAAEAAAIATAAADATAKVAAQAEVDSGTYLTVVEHGATASTARPAGAVLVLWVGTVTPLNAAADDLFEDTSSTPAALKRWTGSAFETVGGASSSDPTTLVVPAGGMTVVLGTPVIGLSNRTAVWLMDAATTEDVGGTVFIPVSWTTFNLDIYWTNVGALVGDVRWRADLSAVTEGAATPDPSAGALVAATAGAQHIVVKTRLLTGAAAPDGLAVYEIIRLGGDVTDTLGNDAGLICAVLTKAS